MQILTNHIGYERLGPKKAILMLDEDSLPPSSQVELINGVQAMCGPFSIRADCASGKWHHGYFSHIDFSAHQVSAPLFRHHANPKHLLFQMTSCANQHFPI